MLEECGVPWIRSSDMPIRMQEQSLDVTALAEDFATLGSLNPPCNLREIKREKGR